MEVAKEDPIPANTLEEIIEVNVNEEKRAIVLYRGIPKLIESEEMIL